MPKQQRMQILTQECFRRLHNTSDDTPDEIRNEILNNFMKDLKQSGYNENDRLNVLKGGFKTFENLKTKERNRIRPFYRSNLFMKVAESQTSRVILSTIREQFMVNPLDK